MIKVNLTKETVSIHRLLQEVIRLQQNQQKTHNLLVQVRTLILDNFPNGDSLEDYEKKTILIPHMETVLHHFHHNFPMQDDDYSNATFLDKLAAAYQIVGDYKNSWNVLNVLYLYMKNSMDKII